METADKVDRLFFRPKTGFTTEIKSELSDFVAAAAGELGSHALHRRMKQRNAFREPMIDGDAAQLKMVARKTNSEPRFFLMPALPPIDQEQGNAGMLASRSMPALSLLDSQLPALATSHHVDTRLNLPPAWEMGLQAVKERKRAGEIVSSQSVPNSPEQPKPHHEPLRRYPSHEQAQPAQQSAIQLHATAIVGPSKPARLIPLLEEQQQHAHVDSASPIMAHNAGSLSPGLWISLLASPQPVRSTSSSPTRSPQRQRPGPPQDQLVGRRELRPQRWDARARHVGFLMPCVRGLKPAEDPWETAACYCASPACPPAVLAETRGDRLCEANCDNCGGAIPEKTLRVIYARHRTKSPSLMRQDRGQGDGLAGSVSPRTEHSEGTANTTASHAIAGHLDERDGSGRLLESGETGVRQWSVPWINEPDPAAAQPSGDESAGATSNDATANDILSSTKPNPAAQNALALLSDNGAVDTSDFVIQNPQQQQQHRGSGVLHSGLRRNRLDSNNSIPPRLSLASVGHGRVSLIEGEGVHLDLTLRSSFSCPSLPMMRRGSTVSVAFDAPVAPQRKPMVMAGARRSIESTDSHAVVVEGTSPTTKLHGDHTQRRAPLRAVPHGQLARFGGRRRANRDGTSKDIEVTAESISPKARRPMLGSRATAPSGLRARALALAAKEGDDGSARQPRQSVATFLSGFCVLQPEQLLMYHHIFDLLDGDKDGLLTARETLRGLRELSGFNITDRETRYVLALLDILEPENAHGASLSDEFEELFAGDAKHRGAHRQLGIIPFKVFALIAAFSERVVSLEPSLKDHLNRMESSVIRKCLLRCRRMFLALSGALTLEELEVELRAGGLDDDDREAVLEHVRERNIEELSFLDYLAYMPLWLGIHHAIIDNPLAPHFQPGVEGQAAGSGMLLPGVDAKR